MDDLVVKIFKRRPLIIKFADKHPNSKSTHFIYLNAHLALVSVLID